MKKLESELNHGDVKFIYSLRNGDTKPFERNDNRHQYMIKSGIVENNRGIISLTDLGNDFALAIDNEYHFISSLLGLAALSKIEKEPDGWDSDIGVMLRNATSLISR